VCTMTGGRTSPQAIPNKPDFMVDCCQPGFDPPFLRREEDVAGLGLSRYMALDELCRHGDYQCVLIWLSGCRGVTFSAVYWQRIVIYRSSGQYAVGIGVRGAVF
jgi:hypothetical protein